MNGSSADLLTLAEQRLSWVERRQAVLSENIANADTPGWRSRDLKPFDAVLSGATLVPARTSPMHLADTASGAAVTATTNGERAPDGNAVSLDKELAKVADTESTHELVTDLYLKYQSLFRAALGH